VDLLDVGRALLRLWWLTLLGVVLAVAGAGLAMVAVGPVYEVKATVLLLPPVASTGPGANPYLGLSGLDEVVDVLTRSMTSQSVGDQVAARWPQAEFVVERDLNSSGPIMIVTVDAKSAADATDITQQLVDLVPTTLEALQSSAGVRSRSMVTHTVLTKFDRPEVVHSDQIRVGLAAAAAGLVGTAFLVALVDGRIGARRRRSKEADDQAAAELSWNWAPTATDDAGPAGAPAEDAALRPAEEDAAPEQWSVEERQARVDA